MAKWVAGIRLADGKDFPCDEFTTWDAARAAAREFADAHHADALWEKRRADARELKDVLQQIEHAPADAPVYARCVGLKLTFFVEARP